MRLQQEAQEVKARDWPDAVAYREAIQSPGLTLGDPILSGARVMETRQGLPIAYTGRFAVVFRLRQGTHNNDWALRCFTSPQDGYGISRGARYRLLADRIAPFDDIFVPFRFVERGIRVAGKWFPTIAMRWASGTPLGRWVEDNQNDPVKLRRLVGALGQLLNRLEGAQMAHGDWQHDNLLISDDGSQVTLVDYDGMFVPGLEGYPSPELGHPNYQHPDRQVMHYGVGLDRFACLVMQAALLGLSHDPSLWNKYGDGESLLFKSADFRAPEQSPLFASLRAHAELDRDEELADAIARLEDACRAGADSTLLPALATEPPKPLPAEILGPPEPTELEREAKADDLDWIRTYSQVVTAGKWWQEGTGGRRGSTQQATVDDRRYLNQLNDPVLTRKSAQLLWFARGALVALTALVLLIFTIGFHQPVVAPLLALLCAVNTVAIGYVNWPRRKLLDELQAEISRMRDLIKERQERIAARTKGASPQALQAARGTAEDYIAGKLRQVPISRILVIPGLQIPTKRQLEQEGIANALELSRRTVIAGIPPHQIAALQAWCRDLEKDYADEYRKLTASARNINDDVRRLEREIAEFEREIERRQREQEQFPAVTLRSYLKELLPFLP